MTPYNKIVRHCESELLTLEEVERINRIPIGTIKKWETEPPKLKEFIRIAIYMQVSPFWLESGELLPNLSLKEQFIIYIIRHIDDEGYWNILDTILHETYEEYFERQEVYPQKRTAV